MSQWTKTRRDPGRTYQDADAAKELRKAMARVRELVAIGIEAEPEYVEIINRLEPEMTTERRKELIRQFRGAVFEHQQRDRRPR